MGSRQKSLKYRWIAIAIFLLDLAFYGMLRRADVSHDAALSDAIQSFIWMFLFSFILHRIHSVYHSRSAMTIYHLSIIAIFSLATTLLISWYGKWGNPSDHIYLKILDELFFLRWIVLFLIYMAIANSLWINKHMQEQRLATKRMLEKERQLAKAEMHNLQQQFQPHFLFNSLNSINALVKVKPDDARQMIYNLSDFLRMTIQKNKEEFNTVAEEITYLKLYMAIEQVRFGNRLNVNISTDNSTSDLSIPALVLQPLVENAIKYGLNSQLGTVDIIVKIVREQEVLLISIENSFESESVEANKGTGYGIKSIDSKLKLLYKRNDLLQIQQENNVFRVIVKIPIS